MANIDFSSMTVIELRKAAKEYGVKLSAGISKADIIARLEAAVGPEVAPAPEPAPVARIIGHVAPPAPAAPAAPMTTETPAETPKPAGTVQFNKAWTNPAPRYSNRFSSPSAGMAPRTPAPRPAGISPAEGPRMTTVRPANAPVSRFGPQAAPAPAPVVRPNQPEVVRPAYLEEPRYQNWAAAENQNEKAATAETENAATEPAPLSPAAAELLAPVETTPCSGVLEFHPDGYGFLRAAALTPSSKDIHVALATIRRYGLRAGDEITGTARIQSNADRNATMLTLLTVNGQEVTGPVTRPNFDELTATYPVKHIPLDACKSTRLADLVAPIGFGSRGLIMAPPNAGKIELLRDYATAIATSSPDTKVMVLLIDENPEDVTLFRDQVNCPVYAATFDQAPELQFRLVDLVLERAKRIAEMGQDAVILVDSITRLAKFSNSSSPTAGRTATGTASPTGLFRAKKLFGAARKLREAGSLTVLATLNVDNGSRTDEAICEEFRDTVNMELHLEGGSSNHRETPTINLLESHTRRADLFLTEEQLQAVNQLRSIISGTSPLNALSQLQPMLQTTATNDELLARLPDWLKLINGTSAT